MSAGDEYGIQAGRSPERDAAARLGRLRCAIHSGFHYLTSSINTYLEKCGPEERKKLFADAGGQLSDLKHWIDNSIPVQDEDHWQNGGPVAAIYPDDRKPDIMWLVIYGIRVKHFPFINDDRPSSQSLLRPKAEVLQRAEGIARLINEAAAEGRKVDGFRY